MIADNQGHKGNMIIVISFIIAIMLTALPVPDWANSWRPAWVPIVLIYWCMAIPDRIGIAVAFVLGLLLDVMHSNILGQNALGLVILAFITMQSYQRIRVFPLAQQAVIVCFFLLLYQLIMLLITNYIGSRAGGWTYWMPAITSMLIWPWLFIILRDIRRKFQIS